MKPTMTRREFLCYLSMGSAAVVLAACQPPPTKVPEPKATETPKGAEQKATEVPKGPEPLELPIVKEPLTLTYWVGLNANVGATLTSFNEMSCYKEIEKGTGVHIEFQHPPTGQETEQFNLMITSRKFPDVIEYGWLTVPGGPAKAIADGVILRLNDLVDKYAPNLKKVLDEHPEWRKQAVTDEGDLYVFPFLRGDPSLLTFQGPIIRKDWLDKVNLSVPATLDDWHTMLVAFKERDPNGNGQADDIPFTPFLYGRPVLGFASSHAFVGAWGITMAFYQVNGVVKFGPLQPEFKEFLKTMAAWYKEGLMDPDFVTMDAKLLDARVTGNQLGSFILNTGSGIGKYTGLMKGKDPNFKLIAAPYPGLKAGDKPKLGQKDFAFTGLGAAITTANKRVTETVKWLDFAYSPEGHMLMNFGVEGVSYTMVNGYPKYTDIVTKNPDGLPLGQAMGRHFRSSFSGPFVQDKRYMEQYAALPEQQESLAIWTQPGNEMLMPPVTPTQEESSRFASVMNDVNTRFEEAFVKVLAGDEPLESWDTVVQQLKQMGIEDAIKIQQAALDRYGKR